MGDKTNTNAPNNNSKQPQNTNNNPPPPVETENEKRLRLELEKLKKDAAALSQLSAKWQAAYADLEADKSSLQSELDKIRQQDDSVAAAVEKYNEELQHLSAQEKKIQDRKADVLAERNRLTQQKALPQLLDMNILHESLPGATEVSTTTIATQNYAPLVQIAKAVGKISSDGTAFSDWLTKLESVFMLNNLWFDLNKKFSALTEPEQKASLAARRLLDLCVEGVSAREIRKHKNSIDAINALKALHDANTATNRIAAQHRLSNLLYRDGDCMITHIAAMRTLFEDLERYSTPYTDKSQADHLINSLPPSMDSMKSMFAIWPEGMYTFDNVAANLRENYNRGKFEQSKTSPTSATDRAYATNELNNFHQNLRKDDRSSRKESQFDPRDSNDRSRPRYRYSERSSSRGRERQSTRFTSRSPSGGRHRSPPWHSHSPFRNNSRTRSQSFRRLDRSNYANGSDDVNKSIHDESARSSFAYYQHGGYSTVAMISLPTSLPSAPEFDFADHRDPAEDNALFRVRKRIEEKSHAVTKKRPRVQSKHRAKRYFKLTRLAETEQLIRDKTLMTTITRPSTKSKLASSLSTPATSELQKSTNFELKGRPRKNLSTLPETQTLPSTELKKSLPQQGKTLQTELNSQRPAQPLKFTQTKQHQRVTADSSPANLNEEFPSYASWRIPKKVRFQDVSKNELVSKNDKRELARPGPISCKQKRQRSPEKTIVVTLNEKMKRKVFEFEHMQGEPQNNQKDKAARIKKTRQPVVKFDNTSAGNAEKADFRSTSTVTPAEKPACVEKRKISTAEWRERHPTPLSNDAQTLTPATNANADMFRDISILTQPPEEVQSKYSLNSSVNTVFASPVLTLAALPVVTEPEVIDLDDTNLMREIDLALSDSQPTQEIKKIEYYPTPFKSYKTESCRNDWIIDSGASVHMTYNCSLFHDISYGNFGFVVVADGNKVAIKGIGTVILHIQDNNGTFTLRLNEVAFVPDLNCSLLSVRALNNQSHEPQSSKVVFCKDSVLLKSKYRTFAIGSWNQNIYTLNEIKYHAAPCIHEWHRRLSHRNIQDIKKAASRLKITISKCACGNDCDACIRAKQPNKPFSHTAEKPESPLDIVVSDLSGPYPPSHAGSKYYMTMLDLATDYTEVWCLRSKNEAVAAVKQYIAKQENLLNAKVKIFRTDRGTEYCNQELSEFLATKGIIHQMTCAESPQQNGAAERLNRTLHDAIRAQLMAHSLCNSLWSEALHHAVYTLNRLHRGDCEHSPIEIFYGKSFEHQFYEFGHPCYASVRKIKLTKLNDRAKLMRFVGIDNVSKGFRVWDGHKVWVERNVRFTSSQGPSFQTYHEDSLVDITQNNTKQEVVTQHNDALDELSQKAPHRSPRFLHKLGKVNCSHVLPTGQEPDTYLEAINSEDKEHWEAAIKQELLNCKTNKIWKQVAKPDNRKVVGCRWVFKIKKDENGNTQTYKARIVAKGFSQTEGIDYDETFSAVATSASLRLFLTKASRENLTVKQFDVTAAFLNGMLKEEIYMRPPPGYEEGNFVLKLEKSIYGLKQAANVWYNTLSTALHEIGFRQSKVDSCLHNRNSSTVYVIHHVDDLLWVSDSFHLIDSLATVLGKSFELKGLGDVQHFLGLDIKRDTNGHFSMCQSNYIDKIAKSHTLEGLKAQSIPLAAGYYKLNQSKALPNNHVYRSLIGSLLYVAVNTRPDIAAAVNILAQKTSEPSEADLAEVKHVLAYLLSTKHHRLQLYNKECDKIPLTGYSDADWGEDKHDRKSISGVLCLVYGAPIIWSSKKQHRVSASTTEAEYYAAGDTIRNLIWLRNLLRDVGIIAENPITLHCDNQSCVKLVLKENTKRSKHFDIDYHFVKDEVKKGTIIMNYVPTEINPADLLTKPLNKNKLETMKMLYRLC